MKRRCCFIGQESLNEVMVYMETQGTKELISKIEKVIDCLVSNNNVSEFICNMDIGLTIHAAKSVLNMKKKYSFLKLRCAIPYETQSEYYPEYVRDKYYSIIEHCDNEVLVSRQKSPIARERSIQYMIDRSDIVFFICEKSYLNKIKRYVSMTNADKKYVYLNPKTGKAIVLVR
ncbi:SLOG family protein [Anaeromicropila herbilytica]|uniref:Uncharacterized protein n=1 Tax=Anaeromicropila herbilytica TaxID=2785025 RepID=A0A7R7ID77_9FIRM|nr:SLOG family protein [Anaeromicropila herbilytica]BCN31282.1 hypothetical protein bsdtb5_25770 [Anaeromicropila herbilytica]